MNSNLWVAHNTQACSETDPDPGGQFQWLEGSVGKARTRRGYGNFNHARSARHRRHEVLHRRATGVVDRSLHAEVDFRINQFPRSGPRDVRRPYPSGRFPALSRPRGKTPVCDSHRSGRSARCTSIILRWKLAGTTRADGELRDYAPLFLDLGNAQPTWATEYIFTQAYGLPTTQPCGAEGTDTSDSRRQSPFRRG